MESYHYEPIVVTDQCHATASSLVSHFICCSCLVLACNSFCVCLGGVGNQKPSTFLLWEFKSVTFCASHPSNLHMLCLMGSLPFWTLMSVGWVSYIAHTPGWYSHFAPWKPHIQILLSMSSTSRFNTTTTRYSFLGFSSQIAWLFGTRYQNFGLVGYETVFVNTNFCLLGYMLGSSTSWYQPKWFWY